MPTETDQNLRVFVVEDQALVASALMDALNAAGVDVAGHARDVSNAFAWLDRGVVPDVALIDVLLSSGPAYALVDRLRALPTATILMTGMDCEQIPSAYQDIPCLQKPFGTRDLMSAIIKVVGTAPPGMRCPKY